MGGREREKEKKSVIEEEEVCTPLEWEAKFNLSKGAILGLSHSFLCVCPPSSPLLCSSVPPFFLPPLASPPSHILVRAIDLTHQTKSQQRPLFPRAHQAPARAGVLLRGREHTSGDGVSRTSVPIPIPILHPGGDAKRQEFATHDSRVPYSPHLIQGADSPCGGEAHGDADIGERGGGGWVGGAMAMAISVVVLVMAVIVVLLGVGR